MDHLPYPDDAEHPRVTIPFLISGTARRYDGHSFLDFPSRTGWETANSKWYECDAGIAAERAQIWLYFGLAKEVFGSNAVEESDFVQSTDGGLSARISTEKLPPSLKQWSGKRRWRLAEAIFRLLVATPLLATLSGGLSLLALFFEWGERQLRPASRLSTKTVLIFKQVNRQVQMLEQYHQSSEEVHLTCLATRALLWSIRNAAVNKDPDVFKRSRLQLSPSPYLKAILLSRGFCPHKLEYITRNCSAATLHYISSYRYEDTSHQNCSSDRCVAHILDKNHYVTKHVRDNCDCELVRVDLPTLTNIIDKGCIPLVVVSDDSGALALEVKALSTNIPYVAISHAWSGGLGNPKSSSLHACQARRIASILQPLFTAKRKSERNSRLRPLWSIREKESAREPESASGIVQCAFWMDTLCIPTDQEVPLDSGIRVKALTQMNRVYAQASQVVVLDDGSFKRNSATSDLQFAASMFTSAWMTRCWTYLEGKLAQSLLAVIDDTFQNPFDLLDGITRRSTRFDLYGHVWDDRSQLEREMTASMFQLTGNKESAFEPDQQGNLVQVWNELTRRTTSRPSDVITILALMLDLSVYEMKLIEDPEGQLLAVLGTQSVLPLSFLLQGPTPNHTPNQYCAWLPSKVTQPVSSTYGSMWRYHDIQTGEHYYKLVTQPRQSYVFKVRHPSSSEAGFRIQLHSTSPEERTLLILVSNTTNGGNGDADLSDQPLFDYIYIILQPSSTKHPQGSGQLNGCRLKVIEDGAKRCSLSYEQAIAYTVLNSGEVVNDMATSQIPPLYDAEEVKMRKELWLQSSWDTWPSLRYQRSEVASPMASKHGLIHVYVTLLAAFEMVVWLVAVGMIVLAFPLADTLAIRFWWTATPAEWFVWALCITSILLRAYVLSGWELPHINDLLKDLEFQRWASSFSHSVPDEGQRAVVRPLSTAYQYHSWLIAGLVAIFSSILLVVGLIVDRPMLYDLAIVGGFLLFEVTVRSLSELLWRQPRLWRWRIKFEMWALNDFNYALPGMKTINPSGWLFLLPHHRKLTAKSNLLANHTTKLSQVFEDPLYLPEDYMRGG